MFPVFIKLNELHAVLVGAGNVGLEKLTAILKNSPRARVTVIAKNFIPEVHILTAQFEGITLIQKPFDDHYLDNADIVIAATDDHDLNNYIRQSAHDRKLLVNVADKPELCDFYLGSIVQKGDLKVAISTNGKSPTVAKRLKEVLNDALPDELDTTLQQMSELRNTLAGDFAYKVKRLNEVTSILINKTPENKRSQVWLIWGAIIAAIAIAVAALLYKEPEIIKSVAAFLNRIF